VCTVSYEHRPGDCWGDGIPRTCPLRDSADAVRADQQHPPAPRTAPSMYELEELNPSVSEATVYKHIQKLIDAGIVKEVALDDDQRRQGGIPGSSTASQRRAGPSSTNTISSPRRKPSNRSTRPSLTSPRRWSSTRIPSPGRRVTLTELASSQYSITVRFRTHPPASGTPTTREAGRPRPRPASRGTGAARRSRLRVHTSPPARRSSSSMSTWLSRRRQYER